MSDDSDEPLSRLARGFRKRTLVTARLASKVGVGFVKRSLGRRTEAEAEADREAAVEAASDVVEQIGSLKGLVMKIGQIASYMPGTLPPEAQRVLSRLQANTTAMEWSKVREVLCEQLGDEPDALFDELRTEPFAAASIGQVHRAEYRGRPVAVKIQYPGIEDVLRSDLRTAGVLGRLGTVGSGFDGGSLVHELRERVLEECDYRLEAKSQRAFGELFATMPGARVPAVIPERSAQRVLTSELDPGKGFYPFCDEAPREARDRAGEIIFRVCFDCLFRHSVYNADPHPGNYLFSDDGEVCFLDFGCVRRFSADMIEAWKLVARSVLENDKAAFRRCFPALGMVGNPKKFDWDYQWDVMLYLYRPFLSQRFTYTNEYVQESYGKLIYENPNRWSGAMPPEWLFLNRLQWGLNSVLAHLGATADWGEIWRAGVGAPSVEAAF